MNWLTKWIISSLLNDNYFNRVIDVLDLFTVRLGSSMSWTLAISRYNNSHPSDLNRALLIQKSVAIYLA